MGLRAVVSSTLDAATFLESALRYVVRRARGNGGSVFVYDAAIGKIVLRAMVDPATGLAVANPPTVALTPGEGVAGAALAANHALMVCQQPDLAQRFAPWIHTHCDTLRAIAALVVQSEEEGRETPAAISHTQAVFCVDYTKRSPRDHRLSASEREAAAMASRELRGRPFANALRRVLRFDALAEIRTAGQQPARLHREIGAFLTGLTAAFREIDEDPPSLAYLQLVDRRRDVIRTVQGYGLPLSTQVSLSHPLRGSDVQARVAEDGKPRIIVGFDPDSFDRGVWERYDHSRYARLWIPLFPFPFAECCARKGLTLEAGLKEVLDWQPPEVNAACVKRMASWRAPLQPPARLIWGTLELGYLRPPSASLSLSPFSDDLATWVMATAYGLSPPLYRATLAGTIEAIGHAAAAAYGGKRLRLTVAMPDWLHPEDRDYPSAPPWPVALPTPDTGTDAVEQSPARLSVDGRVLSPASCLEESAPEFARLLLRCVDESLRVAMRLDDHVADQYVLVSGSQRSEYVGTEHPDLALQPILSEICREAGAIQCTSRLYERDDTTGDWSMLTPTTEWPPTEVACQELDSKDLTSAVAAGAPRYPDTNEPSLSCDVLMPLELADHVTALILLRFPAGTVFDDARQRELEGRAARWIHRLSLRRLAIGYRYAALMLRLRRDIASVRQRAERPSATTRHLDELVRELLRAGSRTLRAHGAILVLKNGPLATRPERFRLYWHVTDEDRSGKAVVLGERRAADTSSEPLRIYPPGDSARPLAIDLPDLNDKDRWASDALVAAPSEIDSCRRLVLAARAVAGTAPTTLLALRIGNAPAAESGDIGRIYVLLKGEHHLDRAQRGLAREFGPMLADSIADARSLDERLVRAHHESHLSRTQAALAGASKEAALVGALFRRLGDDPRGSRSELYWGLADDAVLWYRSSATRELVARAGRGAGLEAISRTLIIPHLRHPLYDLSQDSTSPAATPVVRTFQLTTQSDNWILSSYGRIPRARWLLSLPITQGDDEVAVLDLVRKTLPDPDESVLLASILRRLADAFGIALRTVRDKALIRFEELLTRQTREHIAQFRARAAYQAIADAVREELQCRECDLYVERDGRMLLHSSTRQLRLDDTETYRYYVEASDSDEPMAKAMRSGHSVLQRARQGVSDVGHISPSLQALLANEHRDEQMVVPLHANHSRLWGLVVVRGPLSLEPEERERGRAPKAAPHFNQYHLDRLNDMTVFVQQTAAMLSIAQRQTFLVAELQHSIAQPFQMIRSTSEEMLRALHRANVPTQAFSQTLRDTFAMVAAIRDRLQAFAQLSDVLEWAPQSRSVTTVVLECCRAMEGAANRRRCRIDTQEVSRVPEAPLLLPFLSVALTHLLDNAIKYSYEERVIKVGVSERAGTIEITIANYGVGIPRADGSRVFEPFFRSRVAEPGAPRGGGIGLATVKHAIETIHRGEVRFTSRPPRHLTVGDTAAAIKGIAHTTTFVVTLKRSRLQELGATRRKAI